MREAVEGGVDTLFTVSGGRGRGDLPRQPPAVHAEQPAAPAAALQAADARDGGAGSRDLEEGDPRDRARAQQLAGADHLARALGPAARGRAEQGERLARVFSTIEERASHLATFIDGYARFAKLPRPRPAEVAWGPLLAGLKDSLSFRVLQPLPSKPAWVDATQIEQVLINLVKNAIESGSPEDEVTLAVVERGGGVAIEVRDRGSGLTDEVLRDALLPFYSTKPKGTGLGLTLCREIVDAHGGRLSIANREGGGALVTVWLPVQGDVTFVKDDVTCKVTSPT